MVKVSHMVLCHISNVRFEVLHSRQYLWFHSVRWACLDQQVEQLVSFFPLHFYLTGTLYSELCLFSNVEASLVLPTDLRENIYITKHSLNVKRLRQLQV